MTEKANALIETLKKRAEIQPLSRVAVEEAIRENLLRPSEGGWVLHHLFGLSMPEAVHRATLLLSDRVMPL